MAKTLEDVKYCPMCGSTGEQVLKSRTDRGNTAHTFNCKNDQCSWFNTGWVVEVKSDGSVVERDTTSNRNKQFPLLTDRQKTIAQRMIDEAKRNKY